MFADDAAIFLADMGSPTSWTPSTGGAAVTGPMLFDRPGEMLEAGQVISNEYQVAFETAAWLGLKREEVLVIGGDGGGASYRLRTAPRPEGDGVFSTVMLTKERP